MKDYRTIVVPVDGSDNSKRAVEHAVTIASTVGASLTLVYVANIVSVISNFDQIPNASGYGRRRKEDSGCRYGEHSRFGNGGGSLRSRLARTGYSFGS